MTEPAPAGGDERAAPQPVAPIPLPPDPLSPWLGRAVDPVDDRDHPCDPPADDPPP